MHESHSFLYNSPLCYAQILWHVHMDCAGEKASAHVAAAVRFRTFHLMKLDRIPAPDTRQPHGLKQTQGSESYTSEVNSGISKLPLRAFARRDCRFHQAQADAAMKKVSSRR